MEKNAIIDNLKTRGINVSEIDLQIASVISSFVEKTAIKMKKDYDGYLVEEIVGFVRNYQVQSLISSFPGAALYLFNTEGPTERMVEAYMRNGYVHEIARYLDDEPYKEKMLYDSKEDFDIERKKYETTEYGREYDSDLASPKFSSLPSSEVYDQITSYSINELKSIDRYNQFVEKYSRGTKISK